MDGANEIAVGPTTLLNTPIATAADTQVAELTPNPPPVYAKAVAVPCATCLALPMSESFLFISYPCECLQTVAVPRRQTFRET